MRCPDCDGPHPARPGEGNGLCSECHGKGKDARGAVCESCGGSARCLTCFGFGTVSDPAAPTEPPR